MKITVNGISFEMIEVEGMPDFHYGPGKDVVDTYPSERELIVDIKDFLISKYAISEKLYETVTGNYKSCKTVDEPVSNVSWIEAKNFVTKLSEMTGKKFRLAYEPEWEYAARGGKLSNGYLYSGSNDPDDVANYNNKDFVTVSDNRPNELGIYGMSGNVWEWCENWYENNIIQYITEVPQCRVAHYHKIEQIKKQNEQILKKMADEYKKESAPFEEKILDIQIQIKDITASTAKLEKEKKRLEDDLKTSKEFSAKIGQSNEQDSEEQKEFKNAIKKVNTEIEANNTLKDSLKKDIAELQKKIAEIKPKLRKKYEPSQSPLKNEFMKLKELLTYNWTGQTAFKVYRGGGKSTIAKCARVYTSCPGAPDFVRDEIFNGKDLGIRIVLDTDDSIKQNEKIPDVSNEVFNEEF